MTPLKHTSLTDWHRQHGARMTEFAGWQMPLHYPGGILHEHVVVRRYGGLFDISHMGRFRIAGRDAVPFLQFVLTNNAANLATWHAHYTILGKEDGSALDDAYLFRLPNEYWLVVNAANTEQDFQHLQRHAQAYSVLLEDMTSRTGMLAVQGPQSEELLVSVLTRGELPGPMRNTLSEASLCDIPVVISRTGYTGEPVGFEVFVEADRTLELWERLVEKATAVHMSTIGLGARDTLRLEAGYTLYGHELGTDPEGNPIPVFAAPSASIAVNLSEERGDFIGRAALVEQAVAYREYRRGGLTPNKALPRVVRPLAVLDPGVARQGNEVYWNDRQVGWVTSGTVVPYWVFSDDGDDAFPTDETGQRAIALAYVDVQVPSDALVQVRVRERSLRARFVPRHGRSDRPPYFRPLIVS